MEKCKTFLAIKEMQIKKDVKILPHFSKNGYLQEHEQ
jgi:hypothetical protein